MASIRKRGSQWQARITRSGYPTVAKSFSSRPEAERWARSIEAEMDQGAYVSRANIETTTFGEVIRRYLETVTPLKRGGPTEAIRLRAVLRNRFTQLSLANLSPQAAAAFRDERLATCKANTVIRDIAALSAIVNHARREWGFAISNPFEQIRKPIMPPGRDRVLSQGEEESLLIALAPINRRNPLMQPLVIVALETAMRRGELLGMRWENVDLARRTAFLPLTKNGLARTVPLSSRAVETLVNMPTRTGELVFPISIAAMEANFLRAVRRAKLNNLHFHDLRHTATSRISRKLPNLIELAAVTGHTSLQMLKRYYHPRAEELAEKLG